MYKKDVYFYKRKNMRRKRKQSQRKDFYVFILLNYSEVYDLEEIRHIVIFIDGVLMVLIGRVT